MKKTVLITVLLIISSITLQAQLIGLITKSFNKKSEAKKVQNLPSQGITGANHQKYIDQIVFDTTIINKEKMNDESLQFKTKFYPNQSILGRVFLSKSVVSYLLKNGEINGGFNSSTCEIYVTYSIDGGKPKKLDYYDRFQSQTDDGKYITTFRIEFLDYTEAGNDFKYKREQIVKELNSLTNGEHQIKIEVFGGDQREEYANRRTELPIASGTFTYVKTKPTKIGVSFNDLKEVSLKDTSLKSKLINWVQNEYKPNEKITFKKTKIISNFEINKDKYGAIANKTITFCAYGVKENGGCIYRYFYAGYNYMGGGTYDDALFFSHSAWSDDKNCDCLENK